jgi:hypothetical protein
MNYSTLIFAIEHGGSSRLAGQDRYDEMTFLEIIK